MKIKQYLLASALCLVPIAASAADLPMKARPYSPPPPPPPFSWNGFYIGASAGAIWQDSTGTDKDGWFFAPGTDSGLSGAGFIGGVNMGYNWQFAPNWVFGIEADIAGTSVDDTNNYNVWGENLGVSSKLTGLGTVRARFGYAWDRTLLYATGGWAYGHVKNAFNYPAYPDEGASSNNWRSGWTVGGGLEYAFTPNWTARVEGLYVDLGNSDAGTNISGCRFGFKNHYGIARVGVNYKF
jgi:outer membrane immunogenic protein